MTDIEKTLVTSQEWLKENTKRYAFKKLEREVIGTGACVECGTCVSNCPVDAITVTRVDGKYIPELTGKCISCGICYAMCPRSLSLPKDLIGEYISIHKARSLIQHVRRQDGGVVTAILTALIRAKEIDAAIVAMHSNEAWLPDSVIATTEDQILESGGTFYTHAPIVEGMMRAFDEGYSKLAVVGTSCNIDAISRLQTHPAGFLSLSQDAKVLKIGLFCMESFSHEGLKRFLLENGIDISSVTRMAIAGGKFMVIASNVEREWAVADLHSIASRSCSYCHDLTSTSADISCGNIGSEQGWTTVIIRTNEGKEAFEQALSMHLIEVEGVDHSSIQSIMNVARMKATRYYNLEPLH